MEKFKSRLKIFGAGILMFAICLCGMVFLPKVENSNICTTASINEVVKAGTTRLASTGTLPEGATSWFDVLKLTQCTYTDRTIYYQVDGLKTAYSNISVLDLPDKIDDIPVGVIGGGAFSNNQNLTSITIPQFLTKFQRAAFSNCRNIVEINYKAINCSNAESWDGVFNTFEFVGQDTDGTILNIGNFVEIIRSNIFNPRSNVSNYCKIKKVNFAEDSVCNTIDTGAFKNCIYLEEIVLPDSLTTIGANAFTNCTSLTSLTIPQNVISIGTGFLSGCKELEEIVFNAKNYEGTTEFITGNIGSDNGYILRIGSDVEVLPINMCKNATYLKEVIFPDVALYDTLSNNIFYNCTNLTKVKLPNNLTSISEYAFYGCSALIDINLPENIHTISTYAFYGCSSLGNIEFWESLSTIGSYAFRYCASFTEIVIPNTITSLGAASFADCTNVSYMYYNANVTNSYNQYSLIFSNVGKDAEKFDVLIGKDVEALTGYLFYGANYMTSLDFEEGTICSAFNIRAITYCTNLKTLTIGEEVTTFYGGAEGVIYGSNNITTINFNAKNCSDLSGSAIQISNSDSGITLNIGEEVTRIPANLLRDDNLIQINWAEPNLCTVIGNYAFQGNPGLKNVNIPEGITNIGESAFYNCTGLEEVTLPTTTNVINNSAFNSCISLQEITLPENITRWGVTVFSKCTSLKVVNFNCITTTTSIASSWHIFGSTGDGFVLNIGEKVTFIPAEMFRNSAVKEVNFAENSVCSKVGDSTFANCTKLSILNIPKTITSIGKGAFSGCSNLSEINFNAENCGNLYSSTFTKVGTGCDGATLKVGENVKVLPGNLFWAETTDPTIYNDIREVNFHEDGVLTAINSNAFAYNTNLEVIHLPETLTTLGGGVFHTCTSLREVTLPDGLTSLGNAFYNCSALIELTIPKNVVSIGANLVTGCANLEIINYNASKVTSTNSVIGNAGSLAEEFTIIFGSDVTTIPTNFANGSTNLKKIVISENVTSIGTSAFNNCTKLQTIDYNAILCAGLLENKLAFNKAGQEGDGITLNIGGSVQKLPAWIFGSATADAYVKITEVNFDNDDCVCVNIGDSAFRNNSALQQIAFPECLEIISSYAFYGCSSLNNVILPENLTTINGVAFGNCVAFTEITIPESVTTIGTDVFVDCVNLKVINYNATEVTTSNAFIGKAGNEADGITINIGENVISIPSKFCYGVTYLRSITIPEGIKTIGTYAFYNCVNLVEINYNATNCTSFTLNNNLFTCAGQSGEGITLNVGNNVEKIPGYMFYPVNDNYNFAKLAPKLTKVNFDIEKSKCKTIETFAFYRCVYLQEVIIPASIIKISGNAFSECNALSCVDYNATNCASFSSSSGTPFTSSGIDVETTILKVGNNVEVIPAYMFYNSKITEVKFADNSICTLIGSYAFSNNSTLSKVNFDEAHIQKIDTYAFNGCSMLLEVILPEGIEIIDGYAFNMCTSLAKIELPDGLLTIGQYAFKGCSSVETITIPESVTTIGASAFADCVAITEFIIPKNITSIGGNALTGCANLSFIYYKAEGEKVSAGAFIGTAGSNTDEFVVYIGNRVKNLPASFGSSAIYVTELKFEENSICEIIYTHVFQDATKLKKITIPESVKSMTTTNAAETFAGCVNLEEIYYNAENCVDPSINYNRFFMNAGKNGDGTTIYIGKNVTRVPNELFCPDAGEAAAPKFVKIVFEEGGECDVAIANRAFAGCIYLEELYISARVTSIGVGAFNSAKSLKVVHFNAENCTDATISQEGASAFSCAGQKVGGVILNISKNVKRIPGYLFATRTTDYTTYNDVIQVNFAEDGVIDEIGNYAFAYNVNLQGIALPDTIKTIGSYAFNYCTSLRGIVIPSSTETIGTCAFANCTEFTEITIPESVVSLGTTIVNNCTYLTTINYNAKNCTTTNAVFKGVGSAENKVTIKIGSLVVQIPKNLCKESTYITEVIFDDNAIVESINSNAFHLTSITEIDIPASVISIDSYAFYTAKTELKATFKGAVEDGSREQIPTLLNVSTFNAAIAYVPVLDINRYKAGSYYINKACILKLVTFDFNLTLVYNDSQVTDVIVQMEPAEEIDLELYKPTRENYEFVGWYLSSLLLDEDKITTTSVILKTTTLYARYKYVGNWSEMYTYTTGEQVYINGIDEDKASGVVDLVIPVSDMSGNSVYGIEGYTFRGSLIQSISFEEGSALEVIGECAFVVSPYLKNVDFSNATNLKTIEEMAFKNCDLRGEMVLPQNVTSLGASVFEGNEITSFVVDNTTLSSEYGFVYTQDKSTLVLAPNVLDKNITINTSTTSIEAYAFVGNVGMEVITGESIVFVDQYAFAGSDLQYFEFPLLETISNNAFDSARLKTIKLSKSVMMIGEHAFSNNATLIDIVLEGVRASQFEIPEIASVIASGEESILVYVPSDNFDFYSTSDWSRFNLVALDSGKSVWKVTIDLVGGSGYSGVYFVVDGETIDLSNTPTKIGYIFERWEQVKDGQNQAFSDSIPIKEDTYIVAVWVAIIYKINYITNEGLIEGTDTYVDTFVITAFGVDFETSVGVKTPEREGYTFIGWYTNEEFDSAKVVEIEYDKMTYKQILGVEEIYLYAKWEINKFVMLFEESSSYTIALDTTTQNPVPWGSNFGFMIALSKSYSQNKIENVVVKVFKEDKTTLVSELYPEVNEITDLHYVIENVKETYFIKVEGLKINTYKVYFVVSEEKTGAENMPETIDVEWGKTITESLSTPTLNGYIFDNWHRRIVEDDKEKVDANPFDFETKIYSDTSLIAKFNVIEYEITLHLNGATLNGSEMETFVIRYTIEDTVALPKGRSAQYNINKVGYTIKGWYSGFTLVEGKYIIDAETEVEVVEKGTTGNLSYVLDFEEIVYKIDYDTNGGAFDQEVDEDFPVTSYTINTETFDLAPVHRSGYSFLGWFTSEVEPYNKVVRIEKGSTQDYKLYALWSANEYNIVYHLNGSALSRVEIQGSMISHETNKLEVSYEYGIYETYYLETATRKGYIFDGWYDNESLQGNSIAYIPNVAITSDQHFYAKWQDVEYTITFDYSYLYSPAKVETKKITTSEIEAGGGKISVININGNPVLEGYTFEGWYLDSEKITTITLDNMQDMTLVAVFNVNKVSVILKGENTKDVISLYYEDNVVNNVDYGTKLQFKLEILNSCYEQSFKKVAVSYSYNDQDYESLFVQDGYYTVDKVTGDIYIKVEGLELNKYTVRFITNGGSAVGNIEGVVHGEKISEPARPTKSGYNFAGWFEDSGFNTEFDFNSKQITSDTYLYASWIALEYKAVLKNNINSEEREIDFDIDNQANIILDDYNFGITGYKFINYYLVKDGKVESYIYKDQDIIKNLASVHESVVILARFEIITYNIIYGLEAGITNPNRTTYTIETDDFELSPVKKDLFVFEGWIDSNTKEKVEVIAKGTTGDIFLIATFRLESLDYVSVKYFAMNTEYAYAEVAVKIGESVGTTPAPKQIDGYKFAGWYTDLSFENKFNENLIILETTSVYAKYDLESYKINYTSNIGNNFNNPTENKKQVTIVDEFNLVAPSKTGYTFVGWYKGVEIDMSGNYNFDNATLVTMIIGQKEQIALCAKFELNTYEITYVLNGGEITEELTYTFNVESNVITLPATISKVGYNFNGWVDKNGDTITKIETSIAEDVEVRAIFTAIEYAIEYVDEHIEDGDVSAGNPTKYTIDSAVSVLKNNTVLGYEFVGWFDEQGNKVESIGGGDRRIGNLVLTAKYELIEYTITYILNDGIMINPNPTSYTIESAFILNSPSKENGYTFTKWTIEGTDNKEIKAIVPGMSGNLVLIANYKYVNNYYIVTYYINENTYLFDSVEKDHALNKVVEPIKNNYIFEGWYLDAELTNKAGSSILVSENMSLYAKFVAETHNIYYSFVDTEGNVINGIANNNDSIFSVEKLVVFNAPVLHGYTFIGFNYNGTNIDNTFGIYEDINIAGVFSLNTYTISYVLGGGQAENIGSYTIKDQDITLNKASKNNAEFLGWYDSVTDEKVTVIDTLSARNYILVAKWKDIEVVIEKDTAGSAGDIIFIVVCVFIVLSMVVATIYMVLEKVNANKKSAKVKRAESILPPKPTDTFSNYGDTRPFQFDDRATSGDGSEFISHRDDDIDSNY